MSSIPGLSGAMEGVSDEDAGGKLKRMIFIMDSMDNAELDSDGLIFVSRGHGSVSIELNDLGSTGR
jgi:signal recognition particle GTPase